MNVIELSLKEGEKIATLSDIHADSKAPPSRVDDILETLIDKLEDVRKKCVERNVKHLFLQGDICNRVQMPFVVINRLGTEFNKFRESGIELYSILGNHDIVRNSIENIEKSPTQTLFTFGCVWHINLNTRVIINRKVMITPVDYTETPPKADERAKVNILLAHMFYDIGKLLDDGKHNITTDMVKELGYDVMVLGHDHEPHPMMIQDNTLILRCGSLLRGTSHDYNFNREPKFLVFNDLDNISQKTIEEVVIKHRKYEDIASSYVLNKKKLSNISGLQDVLSNLAERLSEGSEVDGDRILDIINTDEDLPNDCRALLLKYISENV